MSTDFMNCKLEPLLTTTYSDIGEMIPVDLSI